ncbi:hypothetical protein GCM10009642_67430 [Nocardiopsis metallicus]
MIGPRSQKWETQPIENPDISPTAAPAKSRTAKESTVIAADANGFGLLCGAAAVSGVVTEDEGRRSRRGRRHSPWAHSPAKRSVS